MSECAREACPYYLRMEAESVEANSRQEYMLGARQDCENRQTFGQTPTKCHEALAMLGLSEEQGEMINA